MHDIQHIPIHLPCSQAAAYNQDCFLVGLQTENLQSKFTFALRGNSISPYGIAGKHNFL